MSSNSGSSEPVRVRTSSAEMTRAVGEAFAESLEAGDVVVLTGDLGSGKTTFVSGVGRGLGVEERVQSPTFTIVREMHGRLDVAHVDLYRLDKVGELEDLGLDELIGGDAVLVVEWGDVVLPVLGDEVCEVVLAFDPGSADPDRRTIELRFSGRSWIRRRDKVAVAVDSRAGRNGED